MMHDRRSMDGHGRPVHRCPVSTAIGGHPCRVMSCHVVSSVLRLSSSVVAVHGSTGVRIHHPPATAVHGPYRPSSGRPSSVLRRRPYPSTVRPSSSSVTSTTMAVDGQTDRGWMPTPSAIHNNGHRPLRWIRNGRWPSACQLSVYVMLCRRRVLRPSTDGRHGRRRVRHIDPVVCPSCVSDPVWMP